MKVKSATFYQAVKLGDGRQHNTVYQPSQAGFDEKYKGVKMFFKNGLMMITGKENREWISKGKADSVIFVGITNIRGFEVEEEELEGTPFKAALGKEEAPARSDMMDFLREKEIKFAGNIKNVDLIVLYNENKGNE